LKALKILFLAMDVHVKISNTLIKMGRLAVANFGDESEQFKQIDHLGDLYCKYYDTEEFSDFRAFYTAAQEYVPEKTSKGCLKLCRFELSLAISELQRAYIVSSGISM
jgi:hypothetical protein